MISTSLLGNLLFGLFWPIWALLAIHPVDRRTFWFESIVPAIVFPPLFFAHLHGLFSNTSLIFLFVFSVVHVIAAHYTYSLTTIGEWFKNTFNLKRNYSDRCIHFIYGFFAVSVFDDLLQFWLPHSVIGKGIIVFSVIVAIGSLYEILEYAVVVVFGFKEGAEFLGFQGDMWDSQKDMLSQTLGAIIGVLLFI